MHLAKDNVNLQSFVMLPLEIAWHKIVPKMKIVKRIYATQVLEYVQLVRKICALVTKSALVVFANLAVNMIQIV